MVCACPKGEPVSERPREIVSAVSVYSLEQAEGDPDVDREDVEVLSGETVQEWAHDRALGEDKDFERVCVLGGLNEVKPEIGAES